MFSQLSLWKSATALQGNPGKPGNTTRDSTIEGFDATTARTAITDFLTAYNAGIRFLSASALTEERTIGTVTTSLRQVAQKATFCNATTPPRLTGSDTFDSVEALMVAALRTLTSVLITSYTTTVTDWTTAKGMVFTAATATTVDPATASIDQVKSLRTTYTGTDWPLLIQAIQGYVKTRVGNTTTAYNLLAGTPADRTKMGKAAKPLVYTLDASGTTLYGSQNGGTSMGFYWRRDLGNGFITGATKVTADSTNNTFSVSMQSMDSTITLYYKAWARNGTVESVGVERTLVIAVLPTVTTGTVTRASTSLTVAGNVTATGGLRILEKGIAYALSSVTVSSWATAITGNTVTRTVEVAGNDGAFSSVISGLVQGSSYKFVAYARNERGIAVGSEVSATFPRPPTIGTITNPSKTMASLTISIPISAVGTGTINEVGVYYSIGSDALGTITDAVPFSETPPAAGTGALTTTANIYRIVSTSTASRYSVTISGLTFNQTVHIVGYASGTEGTGFSTKTSFTTTDASLPTVTTTSITPTSLSVTLSGNITSNGGTTITNRGILYVASPAMSMTSLTKTTADAVYLEDTPNNLSTGAFSFSAILPPESNYFYVAYATNAKGTAYGTIFSFRTPSLPTINHNNYISTRSQITVSGRITNLGGVTTIQSAGVVYSTSNTLPTIADTIVTVTSPALSTLFSGSFPAANTTTVYYARVFVTTSVGTAYSANVLQTKGFSVTAGAGLLTTANSGYNLYAITSEALSGVTGNSTTITVTGRNIINYFVVGGGGGGGSGGFDRTCGGGGAGGLLYSTNTPFIEGTYTISVGAGGAVDTNGVSSSIYGPLGFGTITAVGGGRGRGMNAPGVGGSGGGGRHGDTTGAGGTVNQGSAGGRGYNGGGENNSQYAGGGGGGAGSVGSNGAQYEAGRGGSGIDSMSSTALPGWGARIGTVTFPSQYAGGGGGGYQNMYESTGIAGSGQTGGGNGARSVGTGPNILSRTIGNSTAGIQYTGGGGGGGVYTTGMNTTLVAGSAGGSGVVFLSVNSSFL